MDAADWLAGLGLAEHASAFEENQIGLADLPTLTDEDLKALGVTALGHRKRILAAAAALGRTALDTLLEQWPSVLALPLRDYANESHPVMKLWHACDVVELTLRFAVMVGVAEAAEGGELPEDVARRLWNQIEKPMLGNWFDMAKSLSRARTPRPRLVPELWTHVNENLASLLDGPTKTRSAESSFLELRNTLAHGAGVTRAVGTRLLTLWQPRFEGVAAKASWLGDLSLIVRDPSGGLGELRGPTARPTPLTAPLADALTASMTRPDSVLLVRGEAALSLWPLALYGEPRTAESPSMEIGESPQVYTRRGEVQLVYTPLGSEGACQAVGEDTALEAFKRFFRLESRRRQATAAGFNERGFERELETDSGELVGRHAEIEVIERLARETHEGIVWISGRPGIGKSFVVSRVACDLMREEDEARLVLPYRFRVGDGRCSREPFLRFAIERLEAWARRGKDWREGNENESERSQPQDRLKELLVALPAGRRVVFVLDGLDEIAGRDSDFVKDVPLGLRGRGVLWVCAGRGERGLPEAFRRAKAIEPFPEGLPRMSEGDIRSMLLESLNLGKLRQKLIAGDRDEGERVANTFIERVRKNADGLPIYVRYVVNDALGGKLSPEAAAPLPPSLAQYHEELLRRCSVGDLHQVTTPLAATLAVAREPLTQEELTALLVRRNLVEGGERSLGTVRQALTAISTMVTLAPDPDGGEGYTLWHHSLRDHMRTSPLMTEAIATARKALAEAGLRPAGDAAEKYLYRQGLSHLLDLGRRDEVLELMTEAEYVFGRLAALPGSQGPSGLATDWCTWLVPSQERGALEVAAEAFRRHLEGLGASALKEALQSKAVRLQELLLWEVVPTLRIQLGGAPALRAVLEPLVSLSRHLASLEPENADYLRDLSVSYDNLGGLDGRADPRKAREWYLRGLEIAQRLLSLEPQNAQYLRDLSISYNNLGRLDGRTDSQKAREWYLRGLEIAQRLSSLEPENTQYLRDLSISYNSLGRLDERTAPQEARRRYLSAMEIAHRLSHSEPGDARYLNDLSISYNNLGRLEEGTNSQAARRWYLKGLETAQRLSSLDPKSTQHLRDLSLSYENVGRTEERADLQKAREWYLKGLRIRRRLSALEPESMEYLRDLSVSYNNLGGLEERADPQKAREWYLKDLRIAQHLAALEPENIEYLHDLSISYENLGTADDLLDSPDASGWFDLAIGTCRDLVRKAPGEADMWQRLAKACGARAGWDHRRGRETEARPYFEEAWRALDRALDLAPRSASAHYLQAWVTAVGGRPEEALSPLSRAVELGYDDADEALGERGLESLRAMPRFHELIAEMRRRRGSAR